MMRVALEVGAKRAFAVAIDWPGLARGAKSVEDALEVLVAYTDRYRRSVGDAAAILEVPGSPEDLDIVYRLKGASGTDYGVPSLVADFDRVALEPAELERRIGLLRGAWAAFDAAAAAVAWPRAD